MTRDARIDAYIAKANPFAQPILTHLRERAHAAAPDANEDIKWGAPAFVQDGNILFIMAAFKKHCAVNFWRGKELLGGKAEEGAMGQLGKIESLSDLPSDKDLDALIVDAVAISNLPKKASAKKTPKPEKLHPDFAKALDDAPDARAQYEAMTPAKRRDYCDWINEAKRDATREKRIATAIEWIVEGKSRNWKYENC